VGRGRHHRLRQRRSWRRIKPQKRRRVHIKVGGQGSKSKRLKEGKLRGKLFAGFRRERTGFRILSKRQRHERGRHLELQMKQFKKEMLHSRMRRWSADDPQTTKGEGILRKGAGRVHGLKVTSPLKGDGAVSAPGAGGIEPTRWREDSYANEEKGGRKKGSGTVDAKEEWGWDAASGNTQSEKEVSLRVGKDYPLNGKEKSMTPK